MAYRQRVFEIVSDAILFVAVLAEVQPSVKHCVPSRPGKYLGLLIATLAATSKTKKGVRAFRVAMNEPLRFSPPPIPEGDF